MQSSLKNSSMLESTFVHLRNHSEFSIRDGLLRLKKMAKVAVGLQMPAIALTDINNFYGLVKFQKACFDAGVKPIFGVDVEWLDENEKSYEITLLAKNLQGYKNLLVLISKSYTEGQDQRGGVYMRRSWIKSCSDGVIALSGAIQGDIGQAIISGNAETAKQRALFWQEIFPQDFYIDIQRLGKDNEEFYIQGAVALADQLGIPIVATNSNCFVDKESFEAHEVRVCINEGRILEDPQRPRRYTQEQYIKPADEMHTLFADLPDALANTVEIAKRCTVEIPLGEYFLPEYPVPKGKTLAEFFRELAHDGLGKRFIYLGFNQEQLAEKEQLYRDRLDFEVDIILQMGFPGYFLIVMDFIRWAKAQGIPVGPGRGSGAGSLVAYALEITDLDPIEYDLLFERFLNPERVSMPDFDVDFCMDKRDQVIQYVSDRYGKEAVGQIVTFGTMAAKAVVRDVARAQGKSYGLADKLSKMIPFEVGMTLEKAYEAEDPLRDFLANDSDAQEIWDMALQLEGTTRNIGKHAGGVVIAPTRLTDFSPLYCDDAGQGLVTQYDKNDVEEAGLVKFDFLGLRTLTIIDWALKMINANKSEESVVDISAIPLDCEDSFKLLQSGQTTAVFQLESRGMKDLIKRLKPDCFEDIVALVALFRPGPLQSGMVDDFINRKLGRAELAFPHPKYQHQSLRPILQPTYGIILYQEQVMQIAQTMAGYSLGEADMLRRAMGKKKPEEMAKQGERFKDGAKKLGHSEELSKNIFDLMEKFAGYGFNKSHSAAYALVSYQTAWLKQHYAPEFMAAVLSSELQNTDKIVTLIEECREIGVNSTPPNVNDGDYLFTVKDASVVYGLGAIKGLGEGPVNSILDARKDGPFTDLFDFCRRTDARKVNRRALEALIKSGAFDSLAEPRWVLLAALSSAVKAAEQNTSNLNAGIVDMFGEMEVDQDVYANFRNASPWLLKQILEGERETLGLYLSGHPIDSYEQDLKRIVTRRFKQLQAKKGKQRVVGMVVAMRTMKTKKGDSMAFVTLDDRTARLECSVFSRTYNETRELLKKDALLVVDGEIQQDDYTGGLAIRADAITSLESVRKNMATAVQVDIYENEKSQTIVDRLAEILKAHIVESDIGCRLQIRYQSKSASAVLHTGGDWYLPPSDEVVEEIQRVVGETAVKVLYAG